MLATTCKRVALQSLRQVASVHHYGLASFPTVLQRHFAAASSSSSQQQHLVVALGGNALLKRGQDMTMENQRQNIADGMKSLDDVVNQHKVTIVHGNGPQVGLLVLESATYESQTGLPQMQLDVLDAETEGMIGYLLEQELSKYLDKDRGMATVLSQIVVDPKDPAFQNPTKFIGPVYTKEQAQALGLPVKPDGDHWRRVVPSPLPVELVNHQLQAVKLLTDHNVICICAGGGGIPCVRNDDGSLEGIQAVIDKDHAAALMGVSLGADGLLILTDVEAAAVDYGTHNEKWIQAASPGMLKTLSEHFPAGSMGPKIESAIDFVEKTGGWAAVGSLMEADKIVAGTAGTRIEKRDNEDFIEYYDK